MAAGNEMVLYYTPDKNKYAVKLKGVLVQMGIRIKNITPEQIHEKVGYLAGIPGYEGQGAAKDSLPGIGKEMMVLKNFTGSRMDLLFAAMRRAGIPRINLKAVITQSNVDWTFYQLYKEISREHELMNSRRAMVIDIEEPDFGCEGRPEDFVVKDKVIIQLLETGEEKEVEAEDAFLLKENIRVGSEVLLTNENRLLAFQER